MVEEHEGPVSIAGRTITSLRFADDIDGLAGSEKELAQLVERIDKTSKAYGMEINAEKTKLMTNNINGIHTKIKASDHKLQTVTNFKYLGAIISDAGSKAEMLSRIAQCTTTLTRLKPIWNNQNITLRSKVRLMRTLIISILLYACETWTLTIELQRRIKAVEMRCYRRLLHISYKDRITNEIVCKKIRTAIGPYEDILTTVKKRKLRWFGHVIRSSGLCKKSRTRHNTREKKTRKAKENMGRQHQRVDRSRLQQQSESSRRPSEMAEDCRRCQQWCPYDPDGSGTQVTANRCYDYGYH